MGDCKGYVLCYLLGFFQRIDAGGYNARAKGGEIIFEFFIAG